MKTKRALSKAPVPISKFADRSIIVGLFGRNQTLDAGEKLVLGKTVEGDFGLGLVFDILENRLLRCLGNGGHGFGFLVLGLVDLDMLLQRMNEVFLQIARR